MEELRDIELIQPALPPIIPSEELARLEEDMAVQEAYLPPALPPELGQSVDIFV